MVAGPCPAFDVPADPAFPALAACAPPERMLETCRSRLTRIPAEARDDWRECRPVEAIYQPGRACRIAYSLTGTDGRRPQLVYARWARGPRSHASAVHVESPDGPFDLFVYPRDRRLRQARSIRRQDWLREASREWFADWWGDGGFDEASWRCTPIKYVPESRLVCRLKALWRGPGGEKWARAYIRFSRQDDSEDQLRLLLGLERDLKASGDSLRVPHALAALPARALLATEFVRGRSLRDLIHDQEIPAVLDAIRRLAGLGHLSPHVPPARPRREVPPAAMLDDLSSPSAGLAVRARALADWAAQAPPEPPRRGLVHGDLHAGQVIFRKMHPYVVDWERAAAGDPTRDIVNLAVEFDEPGAPVKGGPVRLATACVEAWRDAGGIFYPESAGWWSCRARVLRAWGLLRHLRPGWRARAERLLELAAADCRGQSGWMA